MKTFFLIIGLLLLFALEISRVYFIMPFPGSQQSNTIDFAYWVSAHIVWLRIAFLILIIVPAIEIFRAKNKWKKTGLGLVLVIYAVIFFFFNFRFEADKMFYQPGQKTFAAADKNTIAKDKLVIGVSLNGEAKAYPIQLIGYHHQVKDTVGGTPVMITYCTVCRTGRVFSPAVDGKMENFRLVGMDHFNAMFEDATTKSWWQQATGVAVAGDLKGKALGELPSQQLTLASWLSEYPNSLIMQPDTMFNKDYKDLAGFDKGTIKSSLEKRDSASWKLKSWVVGVKYYNTAKAYDWNRLVSDELIQDSLAGLSIVIALESDTASYHVYNRTVDMQVLRFIKQKGIDSLTDINTSSVWTLQGVCTRGPLYGKKLTPVQSYQEFWHAWQQFNPGTLKYD